MKLKYTILRSGTQICGYGDKTVIYCKGTGVPPPERKMYTQPNPLAPIPKPPSTHEFLRQKLGLDSIGKSRTGKY